MDKKRINNPILKQSQEHELLVEYFAKIDKMIGENNLSALTLVLRRLINFMKKDIYTHFEMEDTIFFRAICQGSDDLTMVALVEELRNEHKQLIALLENVGDRVNAKLLTTRETPRKVANAVIPLMALMRQHVRKEIEILFPYINENKKCLALINKLNAMKMTKIDTIIQQLNVS